MRQDQMFNPDTIATALLQGEGDAIVVCDREGIIRFWNPGAVRIFGFTRDEAVGQSLDIIVPERQRARHWEGYHTMMRTGQSRYSGGAMLSVPSQHKNGARLSIEFTIVPVKDAQGQVTALAAIMRDVTARFEEVKALRQQLRARAAG